MESDGTVTGTLGTIAPRRDVGGHLLAASLAPIPTSLSQTGLLLSQDSGLGETDPTFLALDLSPDWFKRISIYPLSPCPTTLIGDRPMTSFQPSETMRHHLRVVVGRVRRKRVTFTRMSLEWPLC